MVDILHKVGIRSARDAVYEALATREGLAAWWTSNTKGDSKVGGRLEFSFTAGGAEIGSIAMQVLEPHRAELVRWQVVAGPEEWIGTTIGFELRQDGDYCTVLFKHQGWKEPVEFMHRCSTKWAMFLMSLKSLVETGEGLPNPHDVKIDDGN